MSAALGVGLYICAFQALAIFGLFRREATLGLIGAGVVAAAWQWRGWRAEVRALRAAAPATPPWTRFERIAAIALALVALPALVAPLAPPAAFDELMYHLPYARLVAQQGTLGIHDWLRYPWFPYNYNLLYAAALQVGDDVLPHFLNALAGALSVLMIFRLGILHANRLTACIGAAIWLGMGDYANALIDMGVALFVLSAFVALWWWRESEPLRDGTRWLCLAAFCLGVAAGSKYQALIFLPLVALFVVRHERRVWRAWAPALLCFLIPCIYWYARNAIMTGDPFNPIGARVFGFTEWVPADYVQQVADVRDHAEMPNALIWSVFLAPFSVWWKRSAAVRAAGWFCLYSVAVWVVTSRYPRYLMASFPLLAMTAAVGWQVLFGWIAAGARRLRAAPAAVAADGPRSGAGRRRLGRGGAAGRAGRRVGGPDGHQGVDDLAHTRGARGLPAQARAGLWRDGLRAPQRDRPRLPDRAERGDLLRPNPIWGDTLGRRRYRDYLLMSPGDTARKLAAEGFTTVVMSPEMVKVLSVRPGFDQYYGLLHDQDGSRAYRLLPTTAP